MGVGLELLGKHVRCPHCKQVVLAPSSSGTAPPKAPPPRARPFGSHDYPTPVSPPPKSPEPVYNFPQKEMADSILSEPNESEDEVFGSHSSAKKVPVPQLPDPPKDALTEVSPSSPSRQRPPLEQTAALPNLDPAIQPTPAPHQPATPPLPKPVPVQPAPPAGVNPWAALDIAAANPAPVDPAPLSLPPPATQTKPQPPPSPAPEPKPARERRSPMASGTGVSWTLLLIVLGYALLATVLAVYGLFIKTGEKLPADHPLSTIPDTFGEFEPTTRKKVTQYKFPVDGELPAHLKAKLGGKVEVGQLVIEPVQIEARPLKVITESKTGKREVELPRAMVMQLRVKNTSPDMAIFPMDPAFTRQASRDDRHPATRLIVGKRPFYGGAIEWPVSANITRKYELQQADDTTPLKPGETRDYVVFSDADPAIVSAVQEATEPMLWRVQLRRGFIEFRGKDVPVTAIIGIEFFRGQVQNLQ